MKRNQIALAVILGFGSTLAIADQTQKDKQGAGATSEPSSTYSRTVVKEPRDVAVSPIVSTYWDQNSKDGYMTRDKAVQFKGSDGKPADWDKLDKDKDGRASRAEWLSYHNEAANLSKEHPGSIESGGPGRAGQ
jgi:hypothetical protein